MPAFLFSCSATPETAIRTPLTLLPRTRSGEAESVDLFFFGAEAPYLLDAYERIDGGIPAAWEASSRSGEKRLAAVANAAESAYDWSDIRSYTQLAGKEVCLESEDPGRPVMTASVPIVAGSPAVLPLTPLLSEIRVRSLCCDFHGRSYAGAHLENVRIYLVNLRDRCRLDGTDIPSWLNAGRLDTARTNALGHPEMLLQDLPDGIGDETVFPDLRLYAYPNPVREEGLGCPFTRLVIEGTLLGNTCYYPISISPMEGGKSHVFDITLTRFGTSDPDIPATRDMLRLVEAVAPWNEMKPITERF